MYSAWAAKRRLQYQLSFMALLLVIGGITAYVVIDKPPSCFDNKQNQDEKGIDCSGVCSARCAFEVFSLSTLWTRPFEVSPGFFSAVTYVENPNIDSYAEDVPYVFKLYDEENILIAERRGTTFITGEPIVPVFLPGVNTGGKEPKRVFFEWEAPPKWHQLHTTYDVEVVGQRVTTSGAGQRIEATLRNKEVRELRDVEAVIIVFDVDRNAIASSKTLVDYLAPQGEADITYTWPHPFSAPVGPLEIVVRVPVQQS